MKILMFLLGLSGLLLVGGCVSPGAVSRMSGHGSKQVFDVEYSTVWDAANGAGMMDDCEIRHVDAEHGYLSLRRVMDSDSFGENIGIWVRSLGPKKTEVEVVSRATGPNLVSAGHREQIILKHIATLLEG